MRNVLAWVLSVTALASFDLQAFPIERPFELHDADGKRMGRFFGSLLDTPSGGVQLSVGGAKYMVPILAAQDGNGLPSASKVDFDSSYLFFTTRDCSGAAHSKPIIFGQPWGVTTIRDSGQVLLYPATEKTVYKTMISALTPTGTCVDAGGSPLAVVPLGGPVDISANYRRPFTIR